MAWSTPKTNWHGATVDGIYTGDWFNATDFNRIKNNLIYLHDLAITLYANFSIVDVGADKTVADYFYADEINQLEQNFNIINENTLRSWYGTAPTYSANGQTMNYTELNRLESAMLDLYNRMTVEYEGRRTLTWNFGIKGGIL